MKYDPGDSFSFDFEPNGIPFGSQLKVKLSPRSYPIQFERKRKYSFLSVEPQINLISQTIKTSLVTIHLFCIPNIIKIINPLPKRVGHINLSYGNALKTNLSYQQFQSK